MSLPNVNIRPKDGGLGLAPNNRGGIAGIVGEASQGDLLPHVITRLDQVEPLYGTGRLAQALVDALSSGAKTLVACRTPVVEDVPGTVGAASRTVAGSAAGAVTAGGGNTSPAVSVEAVAEVPATTTLEFKCTTGGTIGVAQFAHRIAGGAWSAPTTPGGSLRLAEGDLDVTLGLAAGTYAQNDTWTIELILGGTGAVVASKVIEPIASGTVTVVCTQTGGRNAGRVTVRVDGVPVLGMTNVTIPVDGQMDVDGYCHLSLNEGAGAPHFIAGDTWTSAVVAAVSGPEEIASAAKRIGATRLGVEAILVTGPTTASTWAALDVLAEVEFRAKGRYMFFMVEATLPEGDESETEWAQARVAEPAVAGSLVRVMVVASWVGTGDDVRSAAAHILGHMLKLDKISYSAGRVRSGGVAGVTAYGPVDEGIIDQLDNVGFTTLRNWDGLSGVFVTNARMLVDDTSDYRWAEWRRVMDRACTLTRLAGLRSAHDEGDVPGLLALQADMQDPLDGMVAKGLCVAAKVTVPTDQDVTTTSEVFASVAIQPKPSMRFITVDIGFTRGESA